MSLDPERSSARPSRSPRAPRHGWGRLRPPLNETAEVRSLSAFPERRTWIDLPPGAHKAVGFAGCVLLAALLAFPMLGARGLFSPAEARYSLIAREMLDSGDWIQPRLNHVRYDEKPPLLYWAIAASFRALGETDFAARVPSAFAFVGTAALTFLIADELAGGGAALLASVVFATSVGPFLFGRFVFTDTLLVFFLTLSLHGLCRLSRKDEHGAAAELYVGMALAGMTKGLIGLVFPVLVAVAYDAVAADRRFRRRLRPRLGAAILAVLFLPWHVVLAIRDLGFLPFYVLNEHVLRFLNLRDPIDYVPLSVPAFWLATFFWLLPWAIFLPVAVRSALVHDRRRLSVPLLWSLVVIGFFTLSPSRMEYYALPAAPSFAVVIGVYWRRAMDRPHRRREIIWPGVLLFGSAALGLAALVLLPKISGLPASPLSLLVSNLDGYYREFLTKHPGHALAFAQQAQRLALPFTLLLCVMGAGTAAFAAKAHPGAAFALFAVGAMPCMGFVDLGHRMATSDRSQRAVARVIERNWTEDSKLVVAGPYEDLCGVTYYTRLPTQMFDRDPKDLRFGAGRGDAHELFLDEARFLAEWRSPARVFVLGPRDFHPPGGLVLREDPRDVLRVNHLTEPPRSANASVSAAPFLPHGASRIAIRGSEQ